MKLTDIRDNPEARVKAKRVGRGEGSGKGKTCGRGHKGQKARSGVAINGFEGGQNPIYMRLPKRGFSNKQFAKKRIAITLGTIQSAIEKGILKADKIINIDAFKNAGMIKNFIEEVKVLYDKEPTIALNIEVARASKAAIKAMEKTKGNLKITVGV